MPKLFYIILAIDTLVPIIAIFYFFVGLADGSVSSRNMLLWIVLLAALVLLWLACLYLYKAGWIKLAWTIAILLGLPAMIGLLYILMIMFGNVRWN
jgi:hypothetical protein